MEEGLHGRRNQLSAHQENTSRAAQIPYLLTARRWVGPGHPSHVARANTALWGRVVSGSVCPRA
jgi:hypothetical protein